MREDELRELMKNGICIDREVTIEKNLSYLGMIDDRDEDGHVKMFYIIYRGPDDQIYYSCQEM